MTYSFVAIMTSTHSLGDALVDVFAVVYDFPVNLVVMIQSITR